MKNVRVVLAVVALLALPFGSVAAQSRGKSKASAASTPAGDCKDQQAASLGRALDAGREAPYGLDKKCDPVPPPVPVPPPPSGPPTGVNEAAGIVYEDLDGSGSYDMFNDLPFEGWTIQLYWDGQFVASATSGSDGRYLFPNLGNSDKVWWVCIIPQAGYVQTQPAAGTACNGNGMAHPLNSPFRTQLLTDFGEMIQ
jgi:hypothetical protein